MGHITNLLFFLLFYSFITLLYLIWGGAEPGRRMVIDHVPGCRGFRKKAEASAPALWGYEAEGLSLSLCYEVTADAADLVCEC